MGCSPAGPWGDDPGGTISQPAATQYRIQFYECNPSCYYWCSEWLTHYLYNNTSAREGYGGSC